MSGSLGGIILGGVIGTIVAAPLTQALDAIFFHSKRGLQLTSAPSGVGQSPTPISGLLVPDCVVEETGRDDLQITEHPVELGATIADHAFKKPREVTLRWSWSNSSQLAEGAVQAIYNDLLSIQNTRQTFTIYTGKSTYNNMVIASLGQTTNAASEYSLLTVIVCKEIIFVETSPASLQSLNNASDTTTNGPVADNGSKQPVTQGPIGQGSTGQGQSQTFGTKVLGDSQTPVGGDSAYSSVTGPPRYAVLNSQGLVSGLDTSPIVPGQLPFTGSFYQPPPAGMGY